MIYEDLRKGPVVILKTHLKILNHLKIDFFFQFKFLNIRNLFLNLK